MAHCSSENGNVTAVKDIRFVTDEEVAEILDGLNPDHEILRDYSVERCYYLAFEEQVEKTPDAYALSDADKYWTYRELNDFANRVARILIERELKIGERVGVHIERSCEMIGCLLGIMKAGGAYVPLEPGIPSERLGYIMEDAGVRCVMTQHSLESTEFFDNEFDPIWVEDAASGTAENPDREIPFNSRAYTIYTSGSTGKPKGVDIAHWSLYNYTRAWNQVGPGLFPTDVVMASTTIAFDVSVTEMFCGLLIGARIHVTPPKIQANGDLTAETIEKFGINYLYATPTGCKVLLAAGWQGHPEITVVAGGEALDFATTKALHERCGRVI
ncbi:MAG: AMP-binding protein, partial [Verrucomicrobiota bacterium]